MLNLDLLGSRDVIRCVVKKEDIDRAIAGLHRDRRLFIEMCLCDDPEKRLKASQLLKHPVLQEVRRRRRRRGRRRVGGIYGMQGIFSGGSKRDVAPLRINLSSLDQELP